MRSRRGRGARLDWRCWYDLCSYANYGPHRVPPTMRLDTGQQMRMDQRMKLDPRMIQSMEILQMPTPALEERIEQELASNPTLETRPGRGRRRDAPEPEREQKQPRRQRVRAPELVVDRNENDRARGSSDDFERLSNMSEQYGESWDANTSESSSSVRVRQADRSPPPPGCATARWTRWPTPRPAAPRSSTSSPDQWHLAEVPADQLAKLGEYLIGFIDADGYIRTPMDTRAAQARSPNGTTPGA